MELPSTSNTSMEQGISLGEVGDPTLELEQREVDWDGLVVEPIQHEFETLGGESKCSPEPPIQPEFETFRGESICAPEPPDIHTDYSDKFKTDTVFESKETLQQWIREVGKNNNMCLVVSKSDFKNRTPRITFGCERGGTFRSKAKKVGIEGAEVSPSTKITGTKKCQCPFSIKATEHRLKKDYWVIESVINGTHNHPLSPYVEGHPYHARLRPEEKEHFIDLSAGGVKPKNALTLLKRKFGDNTSSLQTLYNAKKRHLKDEAGLLTEFQQLMHLAVDAGYVISDRRYSDTEVVQSFFFAHPDSISLAKCFPFVFIMDCTYKTNMWRWPLFEIVGVTSTMRTFSVCYCFMEHETMDDFRWALERFRELLFDHQTPSAIVTDREQALINALEVVFPDTTHLLCRWHIAMGIEKKGKAVLPKDGEDPEGELKVRWRRSWDKVVFSRTLEEYESTLQALQDEWKQWPQLYAYACTWLDVKEKFVSVWTDKVFHLGNTSTNRVEGAHATLKDGLMKSSRHNFLSMWKLIKNSVEIQVSEIKKSFTMSLNQIKHEHRIFLFRDLRGSVSTQCLERLKGSLERYNSGIDYPVKCGCREYHTHGLPCACRVGSCVRSNKSIEMCNIHPFWKKLSVVPMIVEIDDLELHEEYQLWCARYKTASSDQRKYMLRRLAEDARPQTTWLSPPTAPLKGKGRPPKQKGKGKRKPKEDWSTKREPSDFERESPAVPTPPEGQHYSLGSSTSAEFVHVGKLPLDRSAPPLPPPLPPQLPPPTSQLIRDTEHYKKYVPVEWLPFIDSIENVPGDGHCGYRAVAAGLGMSSEDGFVQVRQNCILELNEHKDLYAMMWGGIEPVEKFIKMVNCYRTPAPHKHWMMMPEAGYVIANFYGRPIIYLSTHGMVSMCFVPQHTRPRVIVGASPHDVPLLCILYVQPESHFVSVRLKRFSPCPPATTFSTRFRQMGCEGWDEVLKVKNDAYGRIFGDKLRTNDKAEVMYLNISDSDD